MLSDTSTVRARACIIVLEDVFISLKQESDINVHVKRRREVMFLERKGLIGSTFVVICVIIALSIVCPFCFGAEPPDVILPKLNELKGFIAEAVEAHPTILTLTNTPQQANSLYNKIDAVMILVEEGNYMGAAEKLERDIAPKVNFCETVRVRARSWLSDDPELEAVAYRFAGMCQDMIEDILDGLTNYNG